jgi:hypothetical protein
MAIAHVTYHYEDESWWIDSPEYPGYTAFASSRSEVTELARAGLPFFAADPDLEIVGLLVEPSAAWAVSAATWDPEPDFQVKGVPGGFTWRVRPPATEAPAVVVA